MRFSKKHLIKVAESRIKFIIETGKGEKGRYNIKYIFEEDEEYRANIFYHGINCGLGYKKRLLKVGMNAITVLKQYQS